MIRRKIYAGLLLLILLSSLFLLLFSNTLLFKDHNNIYKISVILRGKNNETWMRIKQGSDQAASEMNVDINYISLSEENSITEQIELLEREKINGADAIIISPADYEKMIIPIENNINKIPIVLIESKINTQKYIPYVSCDNYQLGVTLAEQMLQMSNTNKKIAIVKNNLYCSSINERFQGFIDTVDKNKSNYIFWEINEDGQTSYNKTKELFQKDNVDIVVTFDTSMLETIAQVKKDLPNINNSINIYGIGSTSKIISLLDEKIISAIGVQNEFNIGYLGVQTAVNMITNKKIHTPLIDSTIINRTNMYSDKNQKLLFPFIR